MAKGGGHFSCPSPATETTCTDAEGSGFSFLGVALLRHIFSGAPLAIFYFYGGILAFGAGKNCDIKINIVNSGDHTYSGGLYALVPVLVAFVARIAALELGSNRDTNGCEYWHKPPA